MSPRPDVSDQRKPQIISAAMRAFVRMGLSKARMEDIAQEAGMSIGGVYWYYGGKSEIIAAIMEQIFASELGALHELVGLDAPVAERLRRFADSVVRSFNQHFSQMPLGREFYLLASSDPEVRAHLREYLSEYQAALESLIDEGIHREEFHAVHSQEAANAMIALYEGLSLLRLVDERAFPWEESFKSGFALFLAGLEKKSSSSSGSTL